MVPILISLLYFSAAVAEDTEVESLFPLPTWYEDSYTPPMTEEEAATFSAKFPNVTESEFPKNLAAWPAGPRPGACWKVGEVEISGSNWTGTCMGLKAAPEILTSEECETACEEEPMCPSWQFNPTTKCWLGNGNSCDASRSDLKDATSERLMHGDVRVLADLHAKKIQILGLTRVGQFTMPDGSHASAVEGSDLCKHYCYSDILCQYWQFSVKDGCWFDNGQNAALQDGLTTSDYLTEEGSGWEDSMVAGEYVQHYCPPPPTTPPPVLPTTTPAPENLTWLWILLGVLGAAILAAIAYYFLKPKPPKKVRAVKKPEPVKEAVPVYRTVYSATGVPSTSYVGTTTNYVGNAKNPAEFDITRKA